MERRAVSLRQLRFLYYSLQTLCVVHMHHKSNEKSFKRLVAKRSDVNNDSTFKAKAKDNVNFLTLFFLFPDKNIVLYRPIRYISDIFS